MTTNNSFDFDALKDVTRLMWQLNFEAIATAGNDEDALRSGVGSFLG